MDIVLIVVIVIVVVLVIAAIALYNNLVKLRNMVDNAWAQIDVQLQRRLDLIPNLVETVKGYASHERGTLDEVTEARAAVVNAGTPAGKMEADNMLTGALKSLFAVAEAYPDLKANVNFQQLQAELSSTEDKISYMRQSYNDTVYEVQHGHPDVSGRAVRGHDGILAARELRCRRRFGRGSQGAVLGRRRPDVVCKAQFAGSRRNGRCPTHESERRWAL